MNAPNPPANGRAVSKWAHHHATFVLAVFTRYKINHYSDRAVHPTEIGPGIDTWTSDDNALAIEEGRRQIDTQSSQLQFLTSRASTLLPLGIAVAIFFLTALDDFSHMDQPWRAITNILLAGGALLTIWGSAVMGAIIGGRASSGLSDATLLTKEKTGIDSFLARDYAELVPIGYDTNAARLTHLGTGITWIVAGTFIGAIGLALTQWAPATEAICSTCAHL